MADYPRETTKAEDKWIVEFGKVVDRMPETLRGFYAPGGLYLFDRDDPNVGSEDSAARGEGVVETIYSRSFDRIDMGDW